MWVAADLLQAAGRPDGLIASTDADSRPEPSWLESQLALVAAGARAIGGLLELAPDTVRDLLPEARARRAEDAAKRLARVRGEDPDAEHHHFGARRLRSPPRPTGSSAAWSRTTRWRTRRSPQS